MTVSSPAQQRPTVAVIPAAGMGTRMRPATRAIPKAFLPIVDRPALQYVVEEAARAGARETYVVVESDVAPLVERHFNGSPPLAGLEEVRVESVIQEAPLGLGHAALMAEPAVAGRPFMCLLVDNLAGTPEGGPLPKMIDAAEGHSVLCLRQVPEVDLNRLGVVEIGDWLRPDVVEVLGAVEKPGADQSPSRLAIMGRYVFGPELFSILRDVPPGYGGEIQLTDAIDALGRTGRCRGLMIESDLLDVGNPVGLLHASTVLGLANADFGPEYRRLLESILDPAD